MKWVMIAIIPHKMQICNGIIIYNSRFEGRLFSFWVLTITCDVRQRDRVSILSIFSCIFPPLAPRSNRLMDRVSGQVARSFVLFCHCCTQKGDVQRAWIYISDPRTVVTNAVCLSWSRGRELDTLEGVLTSRIWNLRDVISRKCLWCQPVFQSDDFY